MTAFIAATWGNTAQSLPGPGQKPVTHLRWGPRIVDGVMAKPRRPVDPTRQPVDLGRPTPTGCGFCAEQVPMSRTHHPPRSVGNKHAVRRYIRRSTPDRQLVAGPELPGGMLFEGQCVPCNKESGDRWDSGYHELHDALGPVFLAETKLIVPGARQRPPATPVRVGAAVRCMLSAALGLDHRLRVIVPELPDLVRSGDPFELPARLDLRLARAIGRRARISGAVEGHVLFGPRINGKPVGNPTIAHCHYPPVAWQLLHREPDTLCDLEGWPSIAHWTGFTEDQEVLLSDVCGPLPMVRLPDATFANNWAQLHSEDSTFIVECDDVAPDTPTPGRCAAA